MRVVGILLLLIALALLAVDLAETAGGGLRIRALGEWWFRLDRTSLQLAQPAIERHVARWLWDPVILTLLRWPAAPVLAVPGALLLLAARRRARRRR